MRSRNNTIVSEVDGVLVLDISTDKYPNTTTLINKSDWIRIRLYEDVGRFAAFKCGRQVYAKANVPGGGFRFMHHLVMQYDGMIDHINRNASDNRLSNLRKCNKSTNGINADLKKNNTSGYTGVWFDGRTNKWSAEIKVNRKKISLGRFDDIEDAATARAAAAVKYFGEFA